MSPNRMRILYGVQGTGNGHITRARAIVPHLDRAGIDVDFIFSGRAKEGYFDMEPFGQWRHFQGLTFASNQGKISVFNTLKKNSVMQLIQDIKALDLSPYDLVITDFEPISAWAARQQGVNSIGLGHQSAFHYDIPTEGETKVTRKLMQWFAPAATQIGLHWHHFGHPILPPIIDVGETCSMAISNKVVVYLGFESPEKVIPLLQTFPNTQFIYYGEFKEPQTLKNISLRPLSREGFKRDLADCEGVISNAGFELISEALHLGKKLLVKPLSGQMEQLSNARALRELALGSNMATLNTSAIDSWLKSNHSPRCEYPDVAKAITNLITSGKPIDLQLLADQLWSQTHQLKQHEAAIA